ncbi:hypothetical protein O181_098806 [Austropuccinia psidii MF-1]|uniref:Integrase catalytic domain-containing protein n=1 Tax=Austropuccinia psidii MF-1 TaxID=1389203 RepID=A0A9Q3JBN9_9BASI|nr:hypothetical protein [Austropuccinia psidii MF-1]
MDWITTLPSSGDKSYNSSLEIVDRYSKTLMILPCNYDGISVDKNLLLWSGVTSHTGLFNNIIRNRDSKLTSEFWTNINRFFGTNLASSTEYHPQTDVLAERMSQSLEEMIRRLCAYGLDVKDSYFFTHFWCTFIPEL